MIAGEQLELATTAKVAATVSDMDQPQSWRIAGPGVGVVAWALPQLFLFIAQDDGSVQKTDKRCSHAGEMRRLSRLQIDRIVGRLYCRTDP